MSGGGKTQTATQQVQIPPEVMARYNAVNARAETAAAKPFQAYSSDPNAFVAPLTATQRAGIQNINQAAGMAQPYFQTAAGLTMAGSQGVGPLTQEQIGYYQSPYTQSVVDATRAGLQQQQGQQLAQQQAEAIKAGAFGGDRSGIQRAQLMGQQGLATAQAISPLYQQAYSQALQTAAGQQGVRAQDLQRQLAAGQQIGGLGTAAQGAALAGAQAQLGAGTAEQQTEQAGKQALYNQFLQERGYDFQTAQFLANIAMGTGALSGSTTTTTQPAPFFSSDRRDKTNIKSLGDGLYAYDYKDDVRRAEEEGRPMPPKRVGPMAQDIERQDPDLVSEVNGHKVVGRPQKAIGGFAGKGGVQAPSYAPPPNAAQNAARVYQNMQTLQSAGTGGQLPQGGQSAGQQAVDSSAPTQSQLMAGQGQMLQSQGALTPAQMAAIPGNSGIFTQPFGPMGGPSIGGKGSVQSNPLPSQSVSYGQMSPSMPPMAPSYGGMQRGFGKGGVRAPSYASGGSVVGSEDMQAILAAIGQPLAFYGGKGLYGGSGTGGAGALGYIPQSQVAQPKLVTAGSLPQQRQSGLSDALDTGSKIANFAKTGKSALTGSPATRDAAASRGLFGSGGEFNKSGFLSGLGGGEAGPSRAAPPPPKGADKIAEAMPQAEWDTKSLFSPGRYSGGLVRGHYAGGGALPYATGDMGEDPLQKIGEPDEQKHELMKPGNLPQTGPGAGDKLLDLGMKAAAIFAMSDARMKDNIEPVGELYDGQPIYRYNMKGSPKTQLGLMAQDLEHNGHGDAVAGLGGIKMVDYKRATDVAAGLAPRRGYATDGLVTEQEDLPLVLAALSQDDGRMGIPSGVLPPVTLSDVEPSPRDIRIASRAPADPGREPVRSDAAPAAPTGVAPPSDTDRNEGVIRDFLQRNAVAESGNRNIPNQAGTSSAFGIHQITKGTWDTIRNRHPQLGLTPEDRLTVEGQQRAAPYHARDLIRSMEEQGVPVNYQNLRMGWFLGESGGPSFIKGLQEAPNAPAYTLVSPAAARANQSVFFNPDGSPRTAQEVYETIGGQRSGSRPPASQQASGVAGGERSARPVSAGMDASEAPYAALFGGAFGGLDPRTQQALTSESFWVPALAGLGSMLSSKSPYLLGAVGEGLVGGTGAYTALQKQSADILKQRFDIARNVFRGPVMNKDGQFVWEDTRTGEMLTQAEYQQRYNAFLTGRSGSAAPSTRAAEPRPGAEAVRTAREVIAAPAPAPSPAPAPAPAPAPPVSDDMPATPVPSGAPPAAAAAPATPPAATAAEPNVAQMRQRALENQALWSNTDPSMNPRVLLPQVNRLDGQIKELEGRADEVSRLATAAAERNPQQGTIYQNQAQSLYAQAAKLREEMRDKLARANQSLDAAVQLDVKAAEARQTKTIERDFLQEILPDGTTVSLPPGTRLPSPAAPQPTQDQLAAPKKAEVDGRTGNLVLARPQAPAGGGRILPDLAGAPGAKVTVLGGDAKSQLAVDEQFQKDFMEKAPSISQARQRYMSLVNAFKLFESGSTASTRAGWAAVAETFGYPEIARSIINGEPAGVQWVEKEGPNLVLDTLKAATPRFAQSEFTKLLEDGTPSPNKLPQTNFQMVKSGVALLNRSEAFIRSWDRASREEGWRSPSAYYSAWGQANPMSKFEESVELQMGNFRGMPLPASDKWVPGVIYTAPSNLPAAQRDALARFGVKPGEPFQYLGRDVPADQRIRRLDPRQLYSIPAMGQ